MKGKVLVFINWGILAIVTFVAIWMVWGLSQPEEIKGDVFLNSSNSNACIDVGEIDEFEYSGCYDASSEMIFLKVDRGDNNYQVNKIVISFVDLYSRSYDLDDVFRAGEERTYKLLANKNPNTINVHLNVVKDFAGSFCEDKSVFIEDCPVGVGGEGVGGSIDAIGGVSIENFVEVGNFPDIDSDTIVLNLPEKEKAWESVCKSSWNCGEWERCVNGVERRECKDLRNCDVSTNSPVSVRRCDGTCVENWECEWGKCVDGVSVPKCKDLNKCGTYYDKPSELFCVKKDKCVPDVVCGEWSECNIDYGFIDLIGKEKIAKISGTRTRLCVDKGKCVISEREVQDCSVGIDIYTKKFKKCGRDYVGVYKILDDNMLAVLEEGRKDDSLNVYFDSEDGVYCDYCFDGVINGDEDGVDCGGSCGPCEGRVFIEKNWWNDFLRSIGI